MIINYIDTYNKQINGFINCNDRAIFNNTSFMNSNNIYAVDKEFKTFLSSLDR